MTTIEGHSKLLKAPLLEQLIERCPDYAKLFPWSLRYSTTKHGTAMRTFYDRIKEIECTLLVIKDIRTQSIFGAYCGEDWRIEEEDEFYGTPETFVYTVSPTGEIKVYHASRKNETFQHSTLSELSIGVGNEAAIILRENFSKCDTHPSSTFNSPSLLATRTQNSRF